MGIYIKGMEMPESCYYCPFADGVWQKNKRCLINGKEMPRDGRDVQQNHINCPLVELPPHGRLIDGDALRQAMYHEAFETDSPMQKWDGGCWIRYKMFEQMEEAAPTIIEAEE